MKRAVIIILTVLLLLALSALLLFGRTAFVGKSIAIPTTSSEFFISNSAITVDENPAEWNPEYVYYEEIYGVFEKEYSYGLVPTKTYIQEWEVGFQDLELPVEISHKDFVWGKGIKFWLVKNNPNGEVKIFNKIFNTWSEISSPPIKDLRNDFKVMPISTTDFMIYNGREIFYWYHRWLEISLPQEMLSDESLTIESISGNSDNLWLVAYNKDDVDSFAHTSYNKLFHWDGKVWLQIPFRPGITYVKTAQDYVFTTNSETEESTLFKWDNSRLIDISYPTGTFHMRDMYGFSNDNIWLRGWEEGKTFETEEVFLHYDGSSWDKIIFPREDWAYVEDEDSFISCSNDDAWLVRMKSWEKDDNTFDSDIFHWDGRSWTLTDTYEETYVNWMSVICMELGDIDGDGHIAISDIADISNLITTGSSNPQADLNCDNVVNVLDMLEIIYYLKEGEPIGC